MAAAPDDLPRIRQLEQQLERGAGRLRFEAPLEAEFRAHLNDAHRLGRRLFALLFVGLLGALLVVDRCCMGARLPPPVIALSIGGIIAPLLLVGLLRSWRVTARLVPATAAVSAALYGLIGAVYLAMLAMLSGPGDEPPYLYETFLILLSALYVVSGLRLLPTVTLGLALWGGYLVSQTWVGLSNAALLESGLVLFAANVAGAATRYVTEVLERQQFLQAQLLRELAAHDPLTGVRNRRAFEEAVRTTWRQARRDGLPVTVAAIDLDHFKQANDQFGHAHGDALLVAVAETLRDMAQRPLDVVARVGGDEFVCLWYGIPDEQVAGFLAEVHGTLNDRLGAEAAGTALEGPRVSASLGAVHLRPHDAAEPARLLARADAALYQAKGAGRSRAALCREDEAACALLERAPAG